MNVNSDKTREIFSRNLQHYMDRDGIDRRTFADQIGFKYSIVSQWLLRTRYPRIDKIEKIANFFNINKSDLIEDNNAVDFPLSDTQIKIAFFGTTEGVTEEMVDKVKAFAKFVKEQG